MIAKVNANAGRRFSTLGIMRVSGMVHLVSSVLASKQPGFVPGTFHDRGCDMQDHHQKDNVWEVEANDRPARAATAKSGRLPESCATMKGTKPVGLPEPSGWEFVMIA